MVHRQNSLPSPRLVVVFTIFTTFFIAFATEAAIPKAQIDALIEFKNQLQCNKTFFDWTNTSSSDPCSDNWSGITCGNNNNNQQGSPVITGLTLPYLVPNSSSSPSHLVQNVADCPGSLSDSLSLITTLESIDLSAPNGSCSTGATSGTNTGAIVTSVTAPGTIGQNANHATLPIAWSSLVNMKSFKIYCQQYVRTLAPPEWSSLSKLEVLVTSGLGMNNLTFFEKQPIASFNQTLRVLDVSSNVHVSASIETDLMFLANFTNLRVLNLAMNALYGTLEGSFISSLTNLEELYLGNNIGISGQLPDSWSALTKLKSFQLINNHNVYGGIPESWFPAFSASLYSFEVSNCSFSGGLSEGIGYWQSLNRLDLSQNSFSSALPQNITKLVKVANFLINMNLFEGSLENLHLVGSQADEPVSMFLFYNRFSGPLPANMHLNNFIVTLSFQFNALSGEFPKTMCQMKNITTLVISHNRLSGLLPDKECEFLGGGNILEFDFSYNDFSGTLPISWSSWQKINYFNCARNSQLGSALPASYSNWKNVMRNFQAHSCNFDGELPASFVNMTKMNILDVSQNCIRVDSVMLSAMANHPNSELYYADFTPSCLNEVLPLDPGKNLSLAAAYLFRKIQTQVDGYGCPAYYVAKGISVELQTTNSDSGREFSMVFAGLENSQTFYLYFFEACVTALVSPQIQCFYDNTAWFSLENSNSIYDDFNGASGSGLVGAPHAKYLVPCEQQARNFEFSLSAKPSWDGVTQMIPPLGEGAWLFSALDAQLLFGTYYRVRFDVGLNDWQKGSKAIRNGIFSRFFTASVCDQSSSVAIPLSTSCAPCPAHATCNGSLLMTVADTPSWRYSKNALPFYPCPGKSQGCVSSTDDDDVNLTVDQQSGTGCREGFTGTFCASCVDDFGMVAGQCIKCPKQGFQMIVLVVGILVFVLALGFLVYISVDLSKYVDQEEDACDRCLQNNCASILDKFKTIEHFLDKHKVIIERIVVTIRQLINHVSLLGALSSMNASSHLISSVKTILAAQQGANSFLLGSFATGLSCFVQNESISTKVYEMWIDLYLISMGVLSFVFLIWFRRISVSVTVALFLSHLIYSPLTEACAKLLALCDDYTFYPARDYLMNVQHNSSLEPFREHKTIRLLSSDHSQNCDDPSFPKFVYGSIVVLVLYSIGFPILIVSLYKLLTWKNKTSIRDEVYTFLTKHYKENCWWFEAVLLLRKFAVALIIGVFPNLASLQLMFFSFLCAMMLAISLKFQPLTSYTANNSEQLSISSALVSVTLISLASSFQDRDGVQIFVAVGIFLTQIIAILSIILFGGSDQKSDDRLFAFLRSCCNSSKKDDGATEEETANDEETTPVAADSMGINNNNGDDEQSQRLLTDNKEEHDVVEANNKKNTAIEIRATDHQKKSYRRFTPRETDDAVAEDRMTKELETKSFEKKKEPEDTSNNNDVEHQKET